jgi:acetyltransferase-like isoleucine patch superfamily enzyme
VQSWLVNGRNIHLGHFVKISAFSSVLAGDKASITIGDNTIIGPGVTIVAFNHGFKADDIPIRYQDWQDTSERSIIIGKDVWIGAHALVLPGSKIGDGSVIAAGCIVRGNVPALSIADSPGALRSRSRFDSAADSPRPPKSSAS